MKKVTLLGGDILAGIFFSILGFFCAYKSFLMILESINEGKVEREIIGFHETWYTSPGLSGTLLGIIMILLGACLTIQAIRKGGNLKFISWLKIKSIIISLEFKRGLLALILFGIYVFGLLGRIHYYIATFLFLSSVMLIFYRKSPYKLIFICAIVSFLLTFFFGKVARIPLP